jgi:hypothetical protein
MKGVTMQKREQSRVLCPLCGNTYSVTKVLDDGVDYMGHARGIVNSYEEGECSCEASRYLNAVTVKSMCTNCISYNGSTCVNVKRNEELKRQLRAYSIKIEGFTLTDTTTRCTFWNINPEILMKYMKTSNENGKLVPMPNPDKVNPKSVFKKHNRS